MRGRGKTIKITKPATSMKKTKLDAFGRLSNMFGYIEKIIVQMTEAMRWDQAIIWYSCGSVQLAAFLLVIMSLAIFLMKLGEVPRCPDSPFLQGAHVQTSLWPGPGPPPKHSLRTCLCIFSRHSDWPDSHHLGQFFSFWMLKEIHRAPRVLISHWFKFAKILILLIQESG